MKNFIKLKDPENTKYVAVRLDDEFELHINEEKHIVTLDENKKPTIKKT